MVKPQLTLRNGLVKEARRLKQQKMDQKTILKQLDDWLIIKFGYSHSTRADYLKQVKLIVWDQTK